MVTARRSRLQQVTEWLQLVRAVYSRLPSGYSGLQQVTAGYSRLQQITECLHWVTGGYNRSPSGYSGLQQVTVGYRVVTVGYTRLQ